MARARDTLTPDLFEVPQPAATLPASQDFRPIVAGLVSQALQGLDRYAVTARMSQLTGRDISKNMLDGYSSESRDTFNLPFCIAPVLEAATDTTLLSHWHATVRGGRILFGSATVDAEIGRLERQREEIATRIKGLRHIRGERK